VAKFDQIENSVRTIIGQSEFRYKINLVTTNAFDKHIIYHGYAYCWINNEEIVTKLLNDSIFLPPYKYDEDQIGYLQQIDTNFSLTEGYLKVENINLSIDYIPHCDTKTLYSYDVPDWVTQQDILDVFIPYVTTLGITYEKRLYGERVSMTYPVVTLVMINNTRCMFINFDPSTVDATIAFLLIGKNLNIKRGDNSCFLSLDYARKKHSFVKF
jgi:hypothetical protein